MYLTASGQVSEFLAKLLCHISSEWSPLHIPSLQSEIEHVHWSTVRGVAYTIIRLKFTVLNLCVHIQGHMAGIQME